ncbi:MULTISPECIES: type VI secretion system baseplate subunit TssK [Pseudomonas]|nr:MULTISPECIES: type VI secretion system baseplate subunit TssK [Pseudomonas]MPQ67704.1 type VI secretion system baseplate subunit TssK [Pseudomonas sp. MWU12-2323]
MRAIPDAIPDAICWSEGMHLLPQHFQLQSLRAEGVSARLAANARPWYWGVQYIELLVEDSGKITVKALEAVMPDGLVVDLDAVKDKEHYPLELKLTADDFQKQSTLMVYLAVDPLWRAGLLGEVSGRLRSLNINAVDLNGSDAPTPDTVCVWRPIVRLVTENQLSDSICLPLLRISHSGGVFSQLDYVPPCPVLTPDSVIGERISKACLLARSKCDFLKGRWRLAQDAGKTLEGAELRGQLVAIGSRLPELQATLDTGVASPMALYLQLTGLVGALYGLQPEETLPRFSPLLFDDMLPGFAQVLDWIEGQLNNIRASYTRRSFDYKDKHFSIALLDRQTPIQQLVIGLRMPSGATPQAAGDWLQNAFRASRAQLPPLIQQRSHGLAFNVLGRNDQVAYGVAEDIRLFTLQAAGDWFAPDTDLCLYMPPGSARVEPVEIMIFDATRD